jgi:hypothetical protein
MTSDHHLLGCLICDISTPYERKQLQTKALDWADGRDLKRLAEFDRSKDRRLRHFVRFSLAYLDEPLDFIFPIPAYQTRATARDKRSHRRLTLACGAARGCLCHASRELAVPWIRRLGVQVTDDRPDDAEKP